MIRLQKPDLSRRNSFRIVVGVAVIVVGFLKMFDIEVPRAVVLSLLVLGIVFGLLDTRRDFRRMRPRRQMRDLMLMCLVLIPVFGLMLTAIVADGEDDMRYGAIFFGVCVSFAVVGAVVGFVRWRRLRAEATMRLWQLRQQRKKRNRQ